MNDFALVLVKPDAFARNLDTVILRLLEESGFEIVLRKIIQLNEETIRAYQPVLNRPSEFGESWKFEAITALTMCPVLVLLIRGKDALQRVSLLKKRVRAKYCPGTDYQSRVIFNLLHTADDPNELENNIRILMPEAQRFIFAKGLV